MAYADGHKTSAELEREVNEQRDRVEARIGEIKERLSPGQLVDELLSDSGEGGSKFASNLGQQLTANPLPAALVGVGLAWLIGSSVNASNAAGAPALRPYRDNDEYPYARLPSGGLRRVSHSADEDGRWWTEFESNEGTRYKAEADSLGRRAGHFTDQAGKRFSGFIDDAGNRIRQFQDESGNILDGAMGWASHAWQDTRKGVGQQVHDLQHAASDAASGAMSGARNFGSNVTGGLQSQTDQLTRQISSLFDQQPLIAGAVAFAAGAALGAALPHTATEDQVLGEQADKVRDKATAAAGDLYEQGKDKAADLYHDVTAKAADVYGNAKDSVAALGQGNEGSAPN
jgi:hypothetical protein